MSFGLKFVFKAVYNLFGQQNFTNLNLFLSFYLETYPKGVD